MSCSDAELTCFIFLVSLPCFSRYLYCEKFVLRIFTSYLFNKVLCHLVSAFEQEFLECAKFRESCAIVVLVYLVPSCLRWSENFPRGYFVGPKYFPVGILWVSNFCRGYFVGLKFFPVGISWVRNFFSWVFRWSKIFSRGYFVGPKCFLMNI